MIKLFTKKRKGFTLIELVVVIAILGILAAIAIPRLTGARDGAEKAAHNTNVTSLINAVELALANGQEAAIGLTDGAGTVNIQKLVDLGYLNSVPKVPYEISDTEGEKKGDSYVIKVEDNTDATEITTKVITVTPGIQE